MCYFGFGKLEGRDILLAGKVPIYKLPFGTVKLLMEIECLAPTRKLRRTQLYYRPGQKKRQALTFPFPGI